MIRTPALLIVGLTLAGCASNKVIGDETGGIMNWSFGNEVMADAIAIDHCRQYDRAAYVTRINRRPGEGIEFKCLDYPVPPGSGRIEVSSSSNDDEFLVKN